MGKSLHFSLFAVYAALSIVRCVAAKANADHRPVPICPIRGFWYNSFDPLFGDDTTWGALGHDVLGSLTVDTAKDYRGCKLPRGDSAKLCFDGKFAYTVLDTFGCSDKGAGPGVIVQLDPESGETFKVLESSRVLHLGATFATWMLECSVHDRGNVYVGVNTKDHGSHIAKVSVGSETPTVRKIADLPENWAGRVSPAAALDVPRGALYLATYKGSLQAGNLETSLVTVDLESGSLKLVKLEDLWGDWGDFHEGIEAWAYDNVGHRVVACTIDSTNHHHMVVIEPRTGEVQRHYQPFDCSNSLAFVEEGWFYSTYRNGQVTHLNVREIESGNTIMDVPIDGGPSDASSHFALIGATCMSGIDTNRASAAVLV